MLLQGFGVAQADIKKLKDAGIHTVEGALIKSRREFNEIKGIRCPLTSRQQLCTPYGRAVCLAALLLACLERAKSAAVRRRVARFLYALLVRG